MSAYQEWVDAGRPWTAATPIAQLAAVLRGHGYTVYILGDITHLLAGTPEDHTPYSATGWPVASPRWYVHALDIMPPPFGLPGLAALGAQLAADKDGGAASWVKYMNWTPAGKPCQHWSWEPTRSVAPSSDAGHIHLSIRSDATHTDIGGYDPVARLRSGGGAATEAVALWPAYPGRLLRLASPMMAGTDVRRVQQRLSDRGLDVGLVDGVYGPITTAAVRAFQRAHGLAVDGIVGPLTWAALGR